MSGSTANIIHCHKPFPLLQTFHKTLLLWRKKQVYWIPFLFSWSVFEKKNSCLRVILAVRIHRPVSFSTKLLRRSVSTVIKPRAESRNVAPYPRNWRILRQLADEFFCYVLARLGGSRHHTRWRQWLRSKNYWSIDLLPFLFRILFHFENPFPWTEAHSPHALPTCQPSWTELIFDGRTHA